MAKLGTAGIRANLIQSQAQTAEEADQEIKSNNVKAIIFEPTLPLGDSIFIDVLNRLIPELASTNNGSRVNAKEYPSLSTLIQTNFYSYPGVLKFRVSPPPLRVSSTTPLTSISPFPRRTALTPSRCLPLRRLFS